MRLVKGDRPSLDRLRELGRVQDAELAAQDLDLERARERFLESAAGGAAHPGVARLGPSRPRWIAPAAFVALAGACAVLLLVLLPSSRSLSFAVGSAEGQVGTWIAAAADAPLPIRFSDGTSLALDADARARVVAADARGARVLLEAGRLTAAVTHTATSTWNFNVGPFDVLVTGTRFELSWSPVDEELKLVLREGSVAVSGPLVGGRRAVAAGETLEVFCKEQRFELTRGEPRAEGPPPPSSAPVTPAAPVAPAASGPAPAATGDEAAVAKTADAPARRPSWRDLVDANEYDEAMTAAEAEGFDRLVARASAADLLMLADAARFSGKPERAAAALTAARSRFAGTGEAAKAAFHLGRMAFDQRRSYAEAERWFGVYLGEQPGGSFAQEALGRIIECRARMGSASGAREAARRYLERYPAGPHAAHAKGLLEEE
ncbi:tetratricopeptide repeat protein [Sorangium sp. So ce296]|uniref:tetratricopeptide repeat protein n=1 Tax=Sorangium sp. So ce296 TaxID=3133296 RepID=UPI003F618814